MKNNILLIVILIILTLIISGIFLWRINKEIAESKNLITKIQNLETEKKIYEGKLQECQKYNLFQLAVSKIGNREWSNGYNCFDHSKDLQKELRILDIESSILINCGRDHAWLSVEIETVSGQFISPDNNFEILEIRRKDRTCFCK